MLISASDYGPFGPVVGYGGAIMATGGALLTLFAGKMKKWRPPDEDLPGGAQAIVLLLCGVGMVLQWYFAAPGALKWFVLLIAAMLLLTLLCFLRYSGLLGTYRYYAEVVTSPRKTVKVPILGGRELLPEAEKKRRKLHVDTQTLFEGAEYKPDLLWSKESRQWVKQRVLIFFIFTLVLGTSALTAASFSVQVLLTQKAAASVIRTEESPGLNKKP